jgi:hypothetical protein
LLQQITPHDNLGLGFSSKANLAAWRTLVKGSACVMAAAQPLEAAQ